MNGNDTKEKYFKTQCNIAKSPQFNKNNYGTFDYDSLSTPPPSDPNQVINFGYFPFNITVPHFEREIIIDTLYLRSNLTKNIVYNIDGKDYLAIQLTGDSSALNYPCSNINRNLTIQQLFRGKQFFLIFGNAYQFFPPFKARFYQNLTFNNSLIIRISEQMENNTYPTSLLLSSLQVNINTCHPSCLTCNGPNQSQCQTCQGQKNSNNECICQEPLFFQNGQCVNQCDSKNGYFQKFQSIKECYYISNLCQSWNSSLQKCDKCLNPLLPQNEQCVSQCSTGYQKRQIINTVNFECVFIDQKKKGQILLTGLHNNFFSQFEIERLGFIQSNFKQINNFSAIHSKCGDYQLLGGFFINKKGSTIQYNWSDNTTQYQQVKVYFKYFLIDYQYAEDSQISVQLNSKNQNITVNQTQFSTSQNICGLEQNDIIGDLQILTNVINGQVNLTIFNGNSNSDDTHLNNITYFGIREVTVFLLNCDIDYCQECQEVQQCTKCQDGYFLDTGKKCQLCDPSCKTCSQAQTCDSCLDQNAKINSKQECQCLSNQYFDKKKLSCQPCSNSNCDQCSRDNPQICTSCSGNQGLLNGNCSDNCGQNYFNNLNICTPCIANCIKCNDGSSCQSCAIGYFLFQNKTCVDNCQDMYFQNTQTQTCDLCGDSNCLNCSQSSSKCSKCKETYLISTQFQCVNECQKEIEYNSNGICAPCSSKISNCQKCQEELCIKCNDPFYLSSDKKQCLSSCPLQYVGNSEGLCVSCAQGCAKCDKTDQSQCSSCIKGYFLQGNKCQISCDAIYFSDEQTNECKLCNLKFNDCEECDNKICKKCNKNKYLDTNSTRCIDNCEQGQYLLTQKNQCYSCSNKKCYTCDQNKPDLCINCKYTFADRYYIYNSDCYPQCPDQSYFEESLTQNNQKQCRDCYLKYENCKLCTSQMCTQCKDGYCINFQTNKCEPATNQNCPDMKCSVQNCLQCDTNICTACKQGFLLYNNSCQTGCLEGYYQDKRFNQCAECKKYLGNNCTACNIEECQKTNCQNQYYDRSLKLKESQCVDKCQDNFFPNSNGICIWCYDYKCKECDPQNPSQCTSCYPKEQSINYLLQDKQCVSICSQGYYLSGTNCIKCQTGCKRCTEIECLECEQSTQFIDPQKKSCVQTCQNNYFPSPNQYNNLQCMQCSQIFEGCNDCDSTECRSCLNNQEVFDPISRKCTKSCPDQYYQIEKKCKQCENPNCQKCDQQQPSRCTQCFSQGTFVFFQEEEGKCVDKCSENEYSEKNKCIKCSNKFGEQCSKCNNMRCFSCSDSSFFISKSDQYKCVSPCPPGQFGDQNTRLCSNCLNQKCNQCYQNNSQLCINCNKNSKNKYLYQNNCIDKCYQKFYFDENNECLSCSKKYGTNCIECDLNNCTKCDILSNQTYLQKDQNKCVENCADKYYSSNKDQILQCLKCPDDNCRQCNPNEPQKCNKCDSGFYFNQIQQQCVNICEKNQYGDDNTGQCIDCNQHFLNCDKCTMSNCLKCQKDYFQVEGDQNCYAQCPFNHIDKILVDPKYDMSINKQCQKCHNVNCAVCDSKNLDMCLSCSDKQQHPYLYKNDCIQECQKYQKTDVKYCYDECPKQFAQDESTKQCIQCPKFVQNNKCVDECEKSTFINPETPNVCVDCEIYYSKNCSLCNINQCKQCSNQNYLYENKCYEQCPQNTYIQENQMTCSIKCDPPLFIQDRTCQQKCRSGYFILKLNGQQVCKKCSDQCKECERTSDTCTECFEGEGQDCFDQKSIKLSTEKQICKQLNNSDLENCEEIIHEQSQLVTIFSYVVQISLLFSLLVALLSHSFNSVFSLFYLQNFQMIANYALLTSNKFLLIKEMALRFLLHYNIFQMIPNPLQNDKNSQKLTNFSVFDSLLPYSNLSKSSFENVFFQVCIILVMVVLIIITFKSKNNLKIMQYFRNNFFIKIFMISSNLIMLCCLHQLYYRQFYGTFDMVFVVISISLYVILWSLMFTNIINYQVKSSLQSKLYQKNILVQNLVYISVFRRIFWVFYELKKVALICFIILYPQNDNAIWIILPFNLIFLIYISVYRPFEQKYQTVCISAIEIFSVILLTNLPFVYTIESATIFIYLAIGFQSICGLTLLILTLQNSYAKLKKCKFSFKTNQKTPKQQDITLEINNSLTFPNNTTQGNLNMIKRSFMPKASSKQ